MIKDQKQDEVDSRINKLGIVCHCYSPDLKKIAVSLPDSNKIEIYEIAELTAPNKWKLIYTLKEHSQTVSVLDWSINNQILTGSYDRNVVVWNLQKGDVWKPELVMMQGNNRAILAGEWSKNGKKFALGTASHKAYVSYYEKENNWWYCNRITGFKSSVVAVSLHPSGRVLATGSTDFSFKLISCYKKEVDENDGYKGVFDNITDIGTILFEFTGLSWVESIAWSPSGSQFAFAVHDATISFGQVDKGVDNINLENCQWTKLPFLTLLFRNENEIIGGGYDFDPISFKRDSSGVWNYNARLIINEFSKIDAVKKESKVRALAKSFNPGVNPMKVGSSNESTLNLHKNPILCIKKLKFDNAQVQMFSTNDINGNLFFW